MTNPFRVPALSLSVVLPALFLAPALADSRVDGSVRLYGTDWTAVDVIAFESGSDIEIVFSDQPFDREAFAADGRIDAFDIMGHPGISLSLTVAPDGPQMCLHTQSRTDDEMISGSLCRDAFVSAMDLNVADRSHIDGRMDWRGDDEFIELAFDVPVYAAAVDRPDGETLPADGGEPGQAVLAHFAALEAGDYEGLKAISHPEAREMMEESEADGDHMELFEFLREISPRNLVVTGGTVWGDNAELSFEAEEDGVPVRGTANVVRFEDQWYFQGTTIHH